jgi:hypothetical protein
MSYVFVGQDARLRQSGGTQVESDAKRRKSAIFDYCEGTTALPYRAARLSDKNVYQTC